MNFTYRIDKTDRIVYLEGGDPSFEEWKQTLLTLFADADYEKGFNFLSDRRSIEEPRTAAYIKAAVRFLIDQVDQVGSCKWASVVSTTVAYGMGRMAQILSENTLEVQVFTDIESARKWLIEDCKPKLP
jgi:hypothetical protein